MAASGATNTSPSRCWQQLALRTNSAAHVSIAASTLSGRFCLCWIAAGRGTSYICSMLINIGGYHCVSQDSGLCHDPLGPTALAASGASPEPVGRVLSQDKSRASNWHAPDDRPDRDHHGVNPRSLGPPSRPCPRADGTSAPASVTAIIQLRAPNRRCGCQRKSHVGAVRG